MSSLGIKVHAVKFEVILLRRPKHWSGGSLKFTEQGAAHQSLMACTCEWPHSQFSATAMEEASVMFIISTTTLFHTVCEAILDVVKELYIRLTDNLRPSFSAAAFKYQGAIQWMLQLYQWLGVHVAALHKSLIWFCGAESVQMAAALAWYTEWRGCCCPTHPVQKINLDRSWCPHGKSRLWSALMHIIVSGRLPVLTGIDHLRNDIMRHTRILFPTIPGSNSMWTSSALVGRALCEHLVHWSGGPLNRL